MLKNVLSPIHIAGCEIPNRVVRTAYATRIGTTMSDELIAYHAVRARGGVGLSILEVLSVHPSSAGSLNMSDTQLDKGYDRLLKAIRPHGMAVFQQLWHGGHNAVASDGSPPWAPSALANPLGNDVPIAMTKDMIDDIVSAFAAAAARCERAGLDGVEVHGAHGYLLQQFLSPAVNRRDDEYGGALQNRARFTLEVMRAVRQAVSSRFPVGIRLAPDLAAHGVDVKTNIAVAQMLIDEQLVDFVNISLGSYYRFHKMIGGMHEGVGYQLPTSTPIAATLDVPTIITGRFRTLEEAEQVLRSGGADMIGMTRAHIADPDIVAKTRAGKVEQIRPCIGCNQGCVGGLFAGRLGCAVNPETGRETLLDQARIGISDQPGKVIVVGGGPAGMEAARVAALRGHSVILFEAQKVLGGALRLAAKLPTRHGIMDIATWLEGEIYRLGVDVRLSSYVDEGDILAEAPDAVIVATGSAPRMDGIQVSCPGEIIEGMNSGRIMSSVDLLTRRDKPQGTRAMVFDDVGHYEAAGIAEWLTMAGFTVDFVTPFSTFAPKVATALMTEPLLERIAQSGTALSLHCNHRIISINDYYTIIKTNYNNLPIKLLTDIIVLITHGQSINNIYHNLQEKISHLVIIGDAKSPRDLQKAICEGHILTRTI